ncbi:MAG: COG1361 S-layer family protein [Halosimplex sp.]
MRTILAGFALVALVVAGTAVGVPQVATPEEGTVVGNPTIDAVATENRVTWGDHQRLLVTLGNDGTLIRGGPERFEERVTTARDLRVSVAEDLLGRPLSNRLVLRDGTRLLGRLERGAGTDLTLDLGVGRGLSPGEYQLPLRVEFDYTGSVRYGAADTEYNDRTRSLVVRVPLRVVDSPRLTVESADGARIEAGDSERYTFVVSNTGTEAATDVGLVLRVDAPLHFGGTLRDSRQTSVFVDRLEPGESRRLTVAIGAQESAAANTYLGAITAYYRTPEGFERSTDDLRLGIPVDDARNGTNGPETAG